MWPVSAPDLRVTDPKRVAELLTEVVQVTSVVVKPPTVEEAPLVAASQLSGLMVQSAPSLVVTFTEKKPSSLPITK